MAWTQAWRRGGGSFCARSRRDVGSDASVHVAFNIGFAAPKPTVMVRAAEVAIGRLTLRLSGSWLSPLYNLLLRALPLPLLGAQWGMTGQIK